MGQIRQRKSIRLKKFNYAEPSFIFITLCARDRQRVFGYIKNGEMHLSEGGYAVKACWEDIPAHFPEVKLHEYIIMPDHIHGIIEITTTRNPVEPTVGVQQIEPQIEPQIKSQIEPPIKPPNEKPDADHSRNQYQHLIPGSVGAIVRGFKIGVSKWFKEHKGIHPVWQRNFYEHIIRSPNAFDKITKYIINNPKKWKP